MSLGFSEYSILLRLKSVRSYCEGVIEFVGVFVFGLFVVVFGCSMFGVGFVCVFVGAFVGCWMSCHWSPFWIQSCWCFSSSACMYLLSLSCSACAVIYGFGSGGWWAFVPSCQEA